jgi:hypothetical protein
MERADSKWYGDHLHKVIVVLSTFVQHYFVPGKIAFAFVQTILLLNHTLVELTNENKNKYYSAVAFFIGTPIGLMAWVEGLTCDKFLIHFGGHLWYDMTIPISMTFYAMYVKSLQTCGKKVKAE